MTKAQLNAVQLYQSYVDKNINNLIPLMVRALSVQVRAMPADPHPCTHCVFLFQAGFERSLGPQFTLVQPYRGLYSDFIGCQVKVCLCLWYTHTALSHRSHQTLSFLTYVLRGFAERMERHKDNLSKVSNDNG